MTEKIKRTRRKKDHTLDATIIMRTEASTKEALEGKAKESKSLAAFLQPKLREIAFDGKPGPERPKRKVEPKKAKKKPPKKEPVKKSADDSFTLSVDRNITTNGEVFRVKGHPADIPTLAEARLIRSRLARR